MRISAFDIPEGSYQQAVFCDLQTALGIAVTDLQDEWQKVTGGPTTARITSSAAPHSLTGEGNYTVGIYGGRASRGFSSIGSFYICQVPSCCGMVLVQHAHGNLDTLPLVLETASLAAKLAGYTYVQYTSIPGQHLDDHLIKSGFKAMDEFRSVRTGNEITIWLKNLYEPKPKARAKKAEERELVAA